MKLRVYDILKPKECACLAAGLAAAVAIYALLIHPSVQLQADLGRAQAAKSRAAAELEKAGTRLQALQHQIAKAEEQLSRLGGSPPPASEKDLQIARVTKLAQLCNVTIDQYSPIHTLEEEDYLAFFVQFTGRGEFAALQHYLDRLESEIDFVDVTHFTITSVPDAATPVCFMSWSCRVNGMRAETAGPGQTPHHQTTRPGSMEVALHEP